jgi:UDP-glucose 4-epimerase
VKICVTGGAGFIGAATIKEANARGHQAWRFDRADGNDVCANLGPMRGAEVVIHLAGMLGTAELFDEAELAIEANVVGTLRVLEFCRDTGAGYVGITMPDSNWANVYQATKLCAMRLATAWHRNFKVPVSHVRAFNAYGPGQKHGPGHPQKIIPTFASHAWRGESIPIWGNGMQTVDLVHVDDVAKMLVDAIVFADDEVLDAGTGIGISVRQVALMVNRHCNSQAANLYLPMRPGEEEETNIVADGEGWDAVGWRPSFVSKRFAETLDFYKP